MSQISPAASAAPIPLPQVSGSSGAVRSVSPSSPSPAVPVRVNAPVTAPTVTQKPATAPTEQSLLTEFSYNKDINQVVITFKRQDTGEVIDQLPPEWQIKWRESNLNKAKVGFEGMG